MDSTLDLGGGFVVPPFGEAHNHNVEPIGPVDERLAAYLRDGVFYVKNPNSLPVTRTALAGKIGTRSTVDVRFANGGWTGAGGHPIGVVQRLIRAGRWTEAQGEGEFLWSADTEPELARKWPLFLGQQPEFVKVYLLYSEEYARRAADTAYVGWRGLDPSLLPSLVRRAHQVPLRASAHVETAADFHAALVAGVDEINHMPGFRGDKGGGRPDPRRYEIAEADARLAGERGVVVVTTLSGLAALDPPPHGPDRLLRREGDALHRRNLSLLKRYQVRLAIGSDSYRDDSAGEMAYLRQLGVFTNVELLRLWAVSTPRAIFPDRKIAELAPGFEASLLVLDGDPTKDWANTARIRLRLKQGCVLSGRPCGS